VFRDLLNGGERVLNKGSSLKSDHTRRNCHEFVSKEETFYEAESILINLFFDNQELL
jgi:hypothetical protein